MNDSTAATATAVLTTASAATPGASPLCAANEKVAGNACVGCPAGTTNAKDDAASGADTTCDAALCAAQGKGAGAVAELAVQAGRKLGPSS